MVAKSELNLNQNPSLTNRPDLIWFAIVIVAGLKEVIIYSSPDDKKKNRGFCFLEYESHKCASLAKRRLETGRVKVKKETSFLVASDYIWQILLDPSWVLIQFWNLGLIFK